MATPASDFVATYSQQFTDYWELNYQAQGRLRGLTQELHGLQGDAWKPKIMNSTIMKPVLSYSSDIPASPVSVYSPTMVFQDFENKLVLSEFDVLNMNASPLDAYAEEHAYALARMEDQIKINAATDTGVVTQVIGGTGDALTVEMLTQAFQIMTSNEISGNDELYLVVDAKSFYQLMQQTEYLSSIFNTAKPLVNPDGKSASFGGFNIRILGDREEGGIPKTGNIRSNFAYAKKAITTGYRMDPNVRMVAVQQNARIETLAMMSLGALVTKPKGVIILNVDESVTPGA